MSCKTRKSKTGILLNSRKAHCLPAVCAVLLPVLFLPGCGALQGADAQSAAAANEPLQAHYCFIAENPEDPQWQRLFEETYAAGMAQGVYVEDLNEDLPSDYTKADLLKIAISMRADGVFIEGDDSEELTELIGEAAANDVPVITVMEDCAESARVSFVETGNVGLGREYARQILRAHAERTADANDAASGDEKETLSVLVILEEADARRGRSVILSAIRDTIQEEGDGIAVDMISETVGDDAFSSAQIIRRRILSIDRIPDFILCFNEQDTANAYQVLVDYNMPDRVTLIGCASSETVLRAIARGAVYAVILPETAQMGDRCIDAMNDYKRDGFVSDYIAVDAVVIDKENVDGYLQNETDG